MKYLLGDTDIAARRLRVLAEVFTEPTRAFLRETSISKPNLALDLGCGPGYTTHLLADTLGCHETVGLDNSERFISLARKRETKHISFHLHDVITVPFPTPPADLIFCRLLLTHIADPSSTVEKWAAQLRPEGLLLVDEVEWIEMDVPVFSEYMGILEAMLKHGSNRLYVGPLLDRFKDSGLLKIEESRVLRFPVENRRAAAMFHLNIQTWKGNPFIRENYSSEAIDRLEGELDSLRGESNRSKGIEWGLRQMVFRRV